MMNRKIKIISRIIVLATFVFSPIMSLAASLGFVLPADKVAVDDVFIAELQLVVGREQINAIDGEIQFDNDTLEVKEISTGGSIFSVWARTPVFSNESGRIIFAGGVPNGLKKDGLVFKIIFTAKKEGEASFTIDPKTRLYLNDGLGTETRPILSNSELSIQATSSATSTDIWQKELADDLVGPTNLSLILGRDPAMFAGKYFLTINAVDEQSGLDRFEVKEGGRSFVTSESPYVLQDQSLRSEIIVMAFDKAGNVSVAKFKPSATDVKVKSQDFVYVSLAIAVLLLSSVLIVIIKTKNKNVPKRKKRQSK